MPQSLAGLNATSLSAWPFADRHGAVQHIQEELSLFNVDAVEILLGQMIKYLEGLLSPRRGVTYAQPSFMSRHPILERSRLSLSDMALLSMYVDLGHPETPSAFLNFDMNGNDLWVCRHHYCYLDPGFRPNHIKHIVKQFGSYDAAAGKVNVHLRTSRGLAAVCGIDPFMAPRVSELNVALEWVSRPEKLNPLFKLAKDLDLTTLSMTGTSSGAGPSSASSHSMATRKADTAQVRDILHAQHPVTRVTINWDSDLDIPALLQEALSHKRVGPLFLTIKTGRQEVSSVMFKNHLGIQQVTADLDELPLKSEGSFLAGKLHNLTIGPTSFSTKVDQAAPWKTKVSSAIQENPALASLTISCEARDFRIILDSIHSILRELYKSSSFQRSLRFIFLKDTYSNITAKFNIAPLDCEEPAAIDATSGSNGPTLFSIVRNFGAFIRVLNLLDNSVANTYLLKEFARSKPTQLVSIMLTLERYVPRSGNDLSTIAILSKNTFKQLTLIGHPKDREALLSLLHAIRSLRGCQILLTRTGSASVKTWIKPAQRVIHRSSRLIVVESVEQMRLMVPELSASGFASLKNAFDRNKRFIVKRKKPKL
ncbi:hypothetical protein BGW39_008749 [Mortierella sp. 14UC]|nr:hypothetical protein BGW39_008749 [Mortierella sp. 14UC]